MSESNTFIFIVIGVKHYIVVVRLCFCLFFFSCEKTTQTRFQWKKSLKIQKG